MRLACIGLKPIAPANFAVQFLNDVFVVRGNGSAEMMEIAPPYEPGQSHDWNWESEISTCTAHCRIQMAPPTAESPVTEQPLALM